MIILKFCKFKINESDVKFAEGLFFFFFLTNGHNIQGPRSTQNRVFPKAVVVWALWVKGYCLWDYDWKTTVDPRLEDVEIIVVGKTSSWYSVKQSNSPWEKDLREQFTKEYELNEGGSPQCTQRGGHSWED